jgi:hypothetical protein
MSDESKLKSSANNVTNQPNPTPLDCSKAAIGVWLVKVFQKLALNILCF